MCNAACDMHASACDMYEVACMQLLVAGVMLHVSCMMLHVACMMLHIFSMMWHDTVHVLACRCIEQRQMLQCEKDSCMSDYTACKRQLEALSAMIEQQDSLLADKVSEVKGWVVQSGADPGVLRG